MDDDSNYRTDINGLVICRLCNKIFSRSVVESDQKFTELLNRHRQHCRTAPREESDFPDLKLFGDFVYDDMPEEPNLKK